MLVKIEMNAVVDFAEAFRVILFKPSADQVSNTMPEFLACSVPKL